MLIDVTPPAAEPVTLAEAKAHCRVDYSDDDSLIESLISAARLWVEAYTRRRLITQTVQVRRGGLGGGVLLPVAPVQSVTSIEYLDTANVLQTLAADQYRLDLSVQPTRIVPAYLVTWPTVLCDVDTVRVTLVVGYGDASDVPQDIRTAIKMMVAHWYEHREAVVTGATTADLPMAVGALLIRHVLWI